MAHHDPCLPVAYNGMHRHNEYVDHSEADHDHGNCTNHAHWAGGHHGPSTPCEISTPLNDPAYWRAVKGGR